jgi:hypothetical protein
MSPQANIKRETVVTLLVHGAVAAVLFWFLAGYCPGAIDRLKNGGHFPTQFRVFVSMYYFVSPCFPFIIPIVAGLLWLDTRVFAFLYRRHGKVASQFWVWGIALVAALSVVFSIWALASAW